MVSDASVNSDFFVAVATAVPVIWVATGVATSTIRHVAFALRMAGEPRNHRGLIFRVIVTDSAIDVSVFRVPIVRMRGNDINGLPFVAFVSVYLTAGFLAEVFSLVELLGRDENAFTAWFVFGLVCIVLVLGTLAIGLSMISVAVEEEAEDEIVKPQGI